MNHVLRTAVIAAASAMLSACVNSPEHAIEIAHASCVNDWAFLYPQNAREEQIDGLTDWHARRDGSGWFAWTGDEKKPGETVNVSQFGSIHSNCYRTFSD
jgi:hypothetical protein